MKNLLKFVFVFCIFNSNAQVYENFTENFDNNDNNWNIGTTETYSSKIEGGFLKVSNNSQSSLVYKIDFPIEHNSDYVIEGKFRQTSGADNYGSGLVWGFESFEDYYYTLISTNNFFLMKGYKDNKEKVYLPWTEQKKKTVSKMGDFNFIRIEKTGNQIKYFVNDKEVFQSVNIKFVGRKVGFYVGREMNLEIDYLKVKRKELKLNLVSNPKNGFVLENMGANINTIYTEKSPAISPDGQTIYYCVDDAPTNTGTPEKSDIYASKLNSKGEWEKFYKENDIWNNEGHNFLISISPDGNTALLGNTYKEDGSALGSGLSISQKRNGVWSIPVKQNVIQLSNDNKFVNYFLTNDGLHLLMSIEKSEGFGDLDLYVSDLVEENKWSAPRNLGSTLNTFASDFSPFLAADSRTMYFSSYGRAGYGSSDIYVTKRLDDTWTNWSEPENLGPEINSDGFDAYYTLSAIGDYAYMVANLEDSYGELDLYRIKLAETSKPDPVTLISGKTYNKKTGELINAEIVYEDLSNAKRLGIAYSTKEDGFKIALPKGGNYGFRAEAEGFIPVSENINLTTLAGFEKKEVKLFLVPIEKGQVVRLNNIFFDYDKATLTSESNAELDRLVKILNDNASMRIEIGGHTDNKGSDDYNLKLSQSRSESVRNYLLSKGIDKTRLLAKGYGESKPSASNDTEEGQQYNRRVEIAIL